MLLNYLIDGSGPALVLLHGLFGSHDNWLTFTRSARHHFTVVSADLRNHGSSPHHEDMSWDELARDIVQLLDKLEIRQASLLGHSLGGKVAMRVSQLHPERTSALVVEDMAPRAYPERHRYLLDAMSAIEPSRFETMAQVEAQMQPAVPDVQVRRFLLKNLRRDEHGKMYWRLGLRELTGAYEQIRSAIPFEPKFPGPTLFIRGELSDYLQEADWPLVKQIFPSAAMAIIRAADHWVHASKVAEFSGEVLSFLNELNLNQSAKAAQNS